MNQNMNNGPTSIIEQANKYNMAIITTGTTNILY